MKSLLKYLLSLGFKHKGDYFSYSLWMIQEKSGYNNTVIISKEYKGYSVKTAVIMNNAVKESKYVAKTIKEVKEIIKQDLR